jgi:hypothetical protein
MVRRELGYVVILGLVGLVLAALVMLAPTAIAGQP